MARILRRAGLLFAGPRGFIQETGFSDERMRQHILKDRAGVLRLFLFPMLCFAKIFCRPDDLPWGGFFVFVAAMPSSPVWSSR